MRSVVSIHDVMPHTMTEISDILTKIPAKQIENIYLLVVPGLNWTDEQITQLKDWQDMGYQIAGHGWTHKISRKNTFYHYLHSFFISRDVAEHLSLSSSEVFELVSNNYKWFVDQGFKPPTLYVPPAWALGKLSYNQLAQLPFRFYEVSAGIFDSEAMKMKNLFLTGYEADRNWRTPILKFWNWLNVKLAGKGEKVLRISIHPYDLTYPLEQDVYRHIESSSNLIDCLDAVHS